MESTKVTRARARAVLRYIEQNPEKHEQGVVIGERNMNYDQERGGLLADTREVHGVGIPIEKAKTCGTQMCVAGTTIFINALVNNLSHIKIGYDDDADGWMRTAGRLLGLDTYEQRLLFYEGDKEVCLRRLRGIANGDTSWTTESIHREL